MQNRQSFGEVLETLDTFSLEEQELLVEILHRRIIAHRREALAHDLQQAQQEFQAGHCQPATPAEIMREIET